MTRQVTVALEVVRLCESLFCVSYIPSLDRCLLVCKALHYIAVIRPDRPGCLPGVKLPTAVEQAASFTYVGK